MGARRPALGHHRGVTTRAELSSLTSTLDELTRRVTALAEQAQAREDEVVAAELFGVERALAGALRRLGRLEAGRR
jgi:hypothetical protein